MKFWFSCAFALASMATVFAGTGGYLGVNISDAHEHGDDHSKTGNGVVITRIIEGSGAEKAGLQRHDVIMSINGEKIQTSQELISYLNAMSPGEKVSLKVARNDETKQYDVELGERALMRRIKEPKKWLFYSNHHKVWLGINYEALNPELAEFFGVDHGILVKSVEEDSPAKAAGLRAGDVLTSFDGQTLESNGDFLKSLGEREEGDQVMLGIKRRGEALDLSVTLAENENNHFNFEHLSSSGNHFNFDFDTGDFEELHLFPNKLRMVKPLMEGLESGSFEDLHKQLEVLREELEKLKKDRDN